MPPPSDLPVSRRTTLRGGALALGAFAVTSCGRIHLPGGGAGAPEVQTAAEQSADIALANRVVGELGVSIAHLQATLSGHPRLGVQLRPLLSAQRAQRAVLRSALPAADRTLFTVTRPAIPAGSAAALARATAVVVAQRDALRAAAGTAHSGGLARVLASAAAGLSQHLAALRTATP